MAADELAIGAAESDDDQLVAAAQADPALFAALYRRYLTRVYRYARARVPTDEDAADATQQVFLQALDALPSYRARGVPFSAWLFRIARNATIDAHRRRRATLAIILKSGPLPLSVAPVSVG